MEPDRDDDALLVAAADDPEAFAQFYRAHVRGVVAYFRRRVGSAELAADLTAETFAAALAGRVSQSFWTRTAPVDIDCTLRW
jgi:DNA-directed RNA polymerase specialized sigma24 family protein